MAEGLSTLRQQTEVGEGLAVGCLVIGVAGVGRDDEPIAAALAAALVSWSWSARYPTFVRRAPTSLDPVLRRSANRRPRRAAHWIVSQGLYVPQLRDDEWDLGAACREVEEDTAIAARQWTALASAFVDRLPADRVWRHPPPRFDDDPGSLDLNR